MKLLIAMTVIMIAAMVPPSGSNASDERSAIQSLPVVEMTKRANCGCCTAWAEHLRAEGFEVRITESDELWNVKRRAGIPKSLDACHTAKVGGYIVEGHVPASDIKRLLSERPDVKGIAVPGMPIGSPGMEAGDRTEPYNVLSFDANGRTEVFESYR